MSESHGPLRPQITDHEFASVDPSTSDFCSTKPSLMLPSQDSGSIDEAKNSFEKYDIGYFYKTVKTLSDEEKYALLTHGSKVEPNFCFPSNSSGRRFQHRWLSELLESKP